jgi:ParB-like chromosome segregation protein Spo0J
MQGNVIEAISVSNLVMNTLADSDKGKAEELAESIKRDGMIHRPVVRPSKDLPGSYKVVAGRKRIYAACEILGWTEVECDVIDVDDEAAESIELAENVFRTALSNEDQRKALIRWRAIYMKERANAHGRRVSTTRTAAETNSLASENPAEVNAGRATAKLSGIHEAPDATASGPTPKPFARMLEKTLGISPSAAKRLDRGAKNLNEGQITILSEAKATSGQVDSVAALGEGDAINHAIKLIGTGMNIDLAIGAAKKVKAAEPVKPTKRGKVSKVAPPPKPKELSDEEWLATFCGQVLGALKHKIAFKTDALLYRQISETLQRFRGSVRKAVDAAKSSAGHNGAFFVNSYRIVHASHPQHWLVCGGCAGDGKAHNNEANGVCGTCFGAAYKLKLED